MPGRCRQRKQRRGEDVAEEKRQKIGEQRTEGREIMVFFGFILTIAVPMLEIFWGRYLNANPPAYMTGRFSFRTKRSKKDEEVWNFSNMLFSHMITVAGVNTGIVAVIFYFASVFLVGDESWAAASLSLAVVQAVCVLVVYRITDFMVKKMYRPADRDLEEDPGKGREEDSGVGPGDCAGEDYGEDSGVGPGDCAGEDCEEDSGNVPD